MNKIKKKSYLRGKYKTKQVQEVLKRIIDNSPLEGIYKDTTEKDMLRVTIKRLISYNVIKKEGERYRVTTTPEALQYMAKMGVI